MNKNMNSPSKLTEFAPLSPEETQPVVASLFSKFFNFTKSTVQTNETLPSPNNDEQSSSGDSESWKQSESRDKTPVDDSSSMLNFSLDSREGRSLPNVLKRISNIVASKSSNLQSYKDSQLRSYWMPDSVSKECYECSERFTTFRRRHHCRVCGQIFCSKCCCDEIPGKIMGCTGDLRVCTYCCKVVLSYLQSSDMRSDLSADLKALQEDLEVKYGNDSLAVCQRSSDDVVEIETVSRKPSVGYMEEKYAIGRSSTYLTSQERSFALRNSASLRMIYEELFRSNRAMILQTHRIRLKSYYNCFIGSELVNWMIAQNKAANRIQATAIGQALFEAGFIEQVLADNFFSDSSAIFKPVKLPRMQPSDFLTESQTSCDAQEPAWVKTIPQHDSTTDSESESKQPELSPQNHPRLPSSSSSFYLDLNLEASTVTLKRPTSEDLTTISIDSGDGIIERKEINIKALERNSKVTDEVLSDTLQVQEPKERNGWHKATNFRSAFGEVSAYNCLMSAYKQHEESLLKQLLNKEGLSENWSETVLSIAHQIVDCVRPDLNHNAEDLDIRQYVQIKKSPGGSKNDCEIVSGVVCSKNVAHRGMNAMIANPTILLLRCGLMYQRVEGKLLSLEPVMLQENDYLGHTVKRITALGPDIVLVHRSVSRLAQDRLRECGVTLVLNVKLSVLERVARCTDANIVDTVDAHISARYRLGTCKKFYLRNFPCEKLGVKTLMYFEGCANPHLGSTILLRGGSEKELKRVKNVTSAMIFTVYSWRLEKSFLMDEFARPPSPKDNSFLDESIENTSKEVDPISKNFVKSSDHFAEISKSTVVDHSNPYDTLKLFKTKTRSISEESKTSDKVDLGANTTKDEVLNNSEKAKLKERLSFDDKRIYGESVSDRSDPLHQYLNEDEDNSFSQVSPNGQQLSVADLPLLNKFKKALEGTILSVSPYLKFTIPFLETETGRNCTLRQFFPKEIYYSVHFEDKVESAKISSEPPQSTNPLANLKLKAPHPFIEAKLTSSADSREVQTLLANFRACGSRLQGTTNGSVEKKKVNIPQEVIDSTPLRADCLDPMSHQHLSVLFCSFMHNSNDTPVFCVNPWVVNMDLYGRNDIALGRFLERYCLTTEYKCPAEGCRAQIAQHARRFAHDGGCVHITLTEMNTEPFGQENANQILMWSKCEKCKSVSPVIPMTDDTWSFSFAKYLELRFHGGMYTRRDVETCQHSLHYDHYQYFSKKNMLAVFKYNKISQWEISLPPPLINIYYDPKQYTNVIEEMKNVALKGDEVFTSIREKIAVVSLEPESLNLLKIQLSRDQSYFKNKIEEAQLKLTSPTLENKKLAGKKSESQVQLLMHRIEDGIVLLKRLISENVTEWNLKISEITAKKKDERPRKFTERSLTSNSTGVIDNDGYITEDTASESQIEDLSPMSADYNAVDAISSVQTEAQYNDTVESSDNEVPETTNPEEIVVIHESPKMHQRSYSDVLPITSEDIPDKKKKKKTILSQLLPSISTNNAILNPLGIMEHHLLPLGSVVPIVVYESEPSSIIAYALDSHDYKHALQEQLRNIKGLEPNPSPLNKRKFPEFKDNCSEVNQSAEFKRSSMLSFLKGNTPNPTSPLESDKSAPTLENSNPASSETEEEKRSTKQQNYIEVQFNDATTNFYCRVYFPVLFAALRENVLPCGEDGYTRSLSRSVQWAARGGKSGISFSKTRDDRFILKEMTRIDMQIFLEFAPNYFAYMEKCQQTKQPTLLGKIVGVYRVSFKNNTTNAALRMSVLVMENLFYNRVITDKFDLKGSVRNRLVNPEDVDREGELVLLDENLLNMSCDSPLYIRPHSKSVLNKAIEEDTKFLADNCVMDYSLLVGLEPNTDELVLGIIDYIRTFTWDKKIETIVKKSGILGGQGKLPTIVSPAEYRSRFIEAMHRYFLSVPDRWTGLGQEIQVP